MKDNRFFRAHVLVALMVVTTTVSTTLGQFPRRAPTPNDTLVSPEVLPDNRLAFRIYAPQAREVSIRGDWVSQGLGEGGNLEKDDRGVWSIIVGPLPADFYIYSFNVDGVRTLDPKNAMIKQGIRGVNNMFLLPGEKVAFASNQPVPHGDIRQIWYQSSTLDTQRRMHVYTPPGYATETRQYPVLYLLHGGGDEDSGWSTIGRAGFILDNLLAAERAQPMLIVMPNGRPERLERMVSEGKGGSLPRLAVAPATSPADIAARRSEARNQFTRELVNDVIPFVERAFRAKPDAESRAIAGLSMGGGQTLSVIMSHPDAFSHVAIWSAGLGEWFSDRSQDSSATMQDAFESQNAAFLTKSEMLNQKIKLFSISAGDRDVAQAGSQSLSEVLKKHDINHDLHISGGGHTWINWRRYLHAYLPRLFL